ncbi:MAG: bifunctional adenosylcobinamide kinase/adenosylcobinamide-phosphate guanylyltransferase [Symbiobacteriaceae bacterium]|nr:bifunctional adenosylcobinamide kinase/adenosylcobinamide-phosphate guanylyltransferase [Symbiobacteriaceae bacterium]
MLLVVGGAYQGKLAYALSRLAVNEDSIYHCTTESTQIPQNKLIIYNLHLWILALIQAEKNVGWEVQNLLNNSSHRIVICDDISGGVVPLEATERLWREEVGRSLILLAAHADEVVRLFCGIPTQLK